MIYTIMKGTTMKKIMIIIAIVITASISAFVLSTVSGKELSGVVECRGETMLLITRDEDNWMEVSRYTHVIGDRYVYNGEVAYCGSGNTEEEAFDFAWEHIS